MIKDCFISNTVQIDSEEPLAVSDRVEMNLEHPSVVSDRGESSNSTSECRDTNGLQDYSLIRDRQRRTNVKPPNRFGYEYMVSFALLINADDPVSFQEAIRSQVKDKWIDAMAEEMESL